MNGLMVNVAVQDTDAIVPRLGSFISELRPGKRRGLNQAIADAAMHLTREHLRLISLERHNTAEALGAQSTGHWGQASEKTTSKGTATEASVTVRQPGIGRVGHDVDIHPKDGLWLTLPIAAAAYGRRAYRMASLFFVQPKGKDYALLGQRPKEKKDRRPSDGGGISAATKAPVQWMYLLVHEVRQLQDRTLLPSDAQYALAAREGARSYVESLLAKVGGAS